MHELLLIRATAQGGVFTAGDVAEFGIHENVLRHWVRVGLVRRLERGGYTIAQPPEQQWNREEQVRRIRLSLLQHPGSAASHQSALILHGVAGYRMDWRTVHLAVDPGQRVRRPGLKTHLLPTGSQILSLDGARAVDLPTALAQYATQTSQISAVVSIDDALNRDLVSLAELEGRFAGLPVCAGRGRLGSVLAAADPFAESPGETRNRLFLRALGIRVVSQVPVGPLAYGRTRRSDHQVWGRRLLVEFDGKGKYAQEGALFAEKQREDWLREIGFDVARITGDDLANPTAARARVEAGLAREARAARLRDPVGPCRYPEPWLWRPPHDCTGPHAVPVPGEVSLLEFRRRPA